MIIICSFSHMMLMLIEFMLLILYLLCIYMDKIVSINSYLWCTSLRNEEIDVGFGVD